MNNYKEDDDNKVSMYCRLKDDAEKTLNGFRTKMEELLSTESSE